MKRLIGIGLGAAALLAGSVVVATPASASGTDGPLCRIVSNAYQYETPYGYIERTVHTGHTFRVHRIGGWVGSHYWVWGHSGESWQDDGWIIAFVSNGGTNNLSC